MYLNCTNATHSGALFSCMDNVTETDMLGMNITQLSNDTMDNVTSPYTEEEIRQFMHKYDISVSIWRYCPPFLLFFGTVGEQIPYTLGGNEVASVRYHPYAAVTFHKAVFK